MVDNHITVGFAPQERDAVGALYWEAFRRKLGPAFASGAVGARLVTAAIRADRVLVARTDDRVLGVCGFHEDGTGALDLTWLRLRSELSVIGALRAAAVLALLDRDEDRQTLVLDGICVSPDARGRGVGSALLSAAEDGARRRGKRSVRLSVIDANPRAARLYRRVGFRAESGGSLGLLGLLYGFDGYTTMEKRLLP